MSAPGDLPRGRREQIAIVGASGRYPGAANLEEFWSLIAAGRSTVREIPPSRWNVEEYYDPRPQQPGKMYCRQLGMLDDVEHFDPLFFGISPAEAAAMDPQHRLFLEESYRAIEEAGYAPSGLDGRKCGVYLGIMGNEYSALCRRAGLVDATGNSASIAAARIAYHLNLKGPAIAVDTACSSSLVAVHLACQGLLAGEIDMAIAGGVSLYLTPDSYINMCGAGMLSAQGRCAAFDASADGFVPGEGVGVLLLKRLGDAIRDGDRIHAVVLGSGINQDGRTNGITAPSVLSQAELLRDVYARHGIEPESVTCLEAHGTGTRLGDPIELEALTTAFSERTSRRQFCALGSVKSNIGHASAAAGVAGVHKLLLALRAHRLAPTLHFRKQSDHFDLANSPFYVNTEARDWPATPGGKRRAAVSSFGYSGTNAHLVLEEWDADSVATRPENGPALLVLSAKTEGALEEAAGALATFLDTRPDISLADAAYTLQVGRSAFEQRLALVAQTRADAVAKLAAYARGERPSGIETARVAEVREGRVRVDDELHALHSNWFAAGKYPEIAMFWLRGLEPRWSELPRAPGARRAHLPTYRFARVRCWADAAVPGETAPLQTAAGDLAKQHLEMLGVVFEPVSPPVVPVADVAGRVVVIGAGARDLETLHATWPGAAVLESAKDPEAWLNALRLAGPIDRLVWISRHAEGIASAAGAGAQARVHTCFCVLKALLALGYESRALSCTLITGDAHGEDWAADPVNAALQGLMSCAAKELPAWDFRMVDVPIGDAVPFDAVSRLGPTRDGALAWRAGRWQRRRLQPLALKPAAGRGFRRGGVYLLVGGAGGVGTVFSEYLIREYAARIVWVGRRSPDAAIREKLDRLGKLGAAPVYIAADATDAAALRAVRAQVLRSHGVIHGVVHSAIQLLDRGLASMDPARFEQGFAAKAQVAANLATVFGTDPLDCMLFFSSLAGFAAEEGQSNYAAGCLFGDALASALARERSFAVRIVNWGFWGNLGATAGLPPHVAQRFADAGIGALRPDEAMAALEILMQGDATQIAVTRRLATPAQPATHRATPAVTASVDVTSRVRAAILDQLAATLKLESARIDPDGAFADHGVDSINSVRIVRGLNESLGIQLPTTCLFDHSSVNRLMRHIVKHHAASITVAAHASEAVVQADTGAPLTPMIPVATVVPGTPIDPVAPGVRSTDIAIIGMSGRFPQSPDLGALWSHLAAGRDVTQPITRWDLDKLRAAGLTCGRGGFLDDIDQFDPLFFNISGTEANFMDPQHRLLLEETWHALEDAGYAGDGVAGSRCGVYMGFNGGDYGKLIEGRAALPAQAMWGNAASVLSSRISYCLDLQGPAITLDTACSSSLVAAHLACQGLWSGETDLALAGGAWIQCTPGFLTAATNAGMLSASGHCHTFDAAADGFVPSEGVGVVVLKRLADALSAGDHIYGVIKGTAINQDGASNGITAPSAASQERLERHVYDFFGIDPARIGMVEAHGTGTKLGDPIEVRALTNSFRASTDRTGFCALGSIKTNIGHTAAAAGVAGLIKVLLSLQHRQIPPSANYSRPNPHIDFTDSPFFVNTTLRHWHDASEGPRLAAVSSFGLSGTNAHMVIEEAPAAPPPRGAVPALVLVSAHRREDLRAQVSALAEYLASHPGVALADASFTLAVGRRHYRYRAACVAQDVSHAREQLRRWLDGESSDLLITEGEPEASSAQQSAVSRVVAGLLLTRDPHERASALRELARLHVFGCAIEWRSLYTQGERRISLPGYRFARKRHWVPEAAPVPVPVASAPPPTPSPSVRRIDKRLSGAEFFLSDHLVQGKPVMPGVAYLELVRACAADAHAPRSVREMRNVVWLRPLVVEQSVDLRIEFAPENGAEGESTFRLVSHAAPRDAAEVLHCQGRITVGGARPAPVVDLDAVRARCRDRELAPGAYYQVFGIMGIAYGRSYRGIERSFVGTHELLAELRLPDSLVDSSREFVLHPALLDGALQASIGFEIGSSVDDSGSQAPRSPMLFALDCLEIFQACSTHAWAWVRARPGELNKLDVDICDADGRVLVRMQGVTSREARRQPTVLPAAPIAASAVAEPVGELTLAPVWEVAVPERRADFPASTTAVVVLGGEEALRVQLRSRFPRARFHAAALTMTVEGLVAELQSHREIGHLIWVTPPSRAESVTSESIITDQQVGALATLRLVKALLQLGYGRQPLGLTVVTTDTQAIDTAVPLEPAHAAVHGLVGTLAKEYPEWSVRLVDVSASEPWPLDELLAIAPDPDGNAWAHRHGRWHRLRWMPTEIVAHERTRYRRNGVYVVIGGAGGVGEAFSSYLIRNYQAQVVWIGLRRRDDVIEQKIARLAALGPAPHYLSADAKDLVALERACADIERRFGTIHGVVHAALLMAGDDLAHMAEQRFWSGLSAKVDVCVRMAQVFAHLPLDFALFFSSIQALEKTPRQSNYAAGCTAEDAFAARLEREWKCTVRVVNWGYWGSVGFAAVSSGYRNWIAQAGMGSIEPEQGMAVLERLLSGPFRQLAFVQTRRPGALRGVEFSAERAVRVPHDAPAGMRTLPVVEAAPAVATGLPAEFEELLVARLFHELVEFGVFDQGRVVTSYERWLRHSLRVLEERGYLVRQPDGWHFPRGRDASAGTRWEECRRRWLEDPQLAAPVQLADIALNALADVLRGTRAATEVLFPQSSTRLVEGIYKNSAVPDFFNRVLCDAVTHYVEQRWRHEPDARLRILEIGAGTGGTTTPLVEALVPYAASIERYVFSDISRSFVLLAEEDYAKRASYMRFAVCDVERPLAGQGMEAGSFDIVIAANVLHATRDIRATLRNVKGALKRNGLLVLNEVATNSLFAHLTFGLLKGWWLHEDEHLRIPGSPALTPQSWDAVLRAEGFEAVAFPAEHAHPFGQQIVTAMSDGWVRERRAPPASAPVQDTAPARVAPSSAAPAAVPAEAAVTYLHETALHRRLRQEIAHTLGIEAADLRRDREFVEYGLDSMLAVQAVEILNAALDVDLTTTSLFDHPTLNALATHLRSKHGARFEEPARHDSPAVNGPMSPRPEADSVRAAIQRIVAQVAGLGADDLRDDREFVDCGIDSMLAVQIVEHLNRELQLELTTTSLFDHPTVAALTAHVRGSGTAQVVDIGEHARPATDDADRAVFSAVAQTLADVLGIGADEIDAATELTAYGLDSMLAVQLADRLNQTLGLELTSTSAFDHPTLGALVRFALADGARAQRAREAAANRHVPARVAVAGSPATLSYTL
jgi:acyl transferase domain-containing protein/acyl carrier protein/SAM-dependent methyltransferase